MPKRPMTSTMSRLYAVALRRGFTHPTGRAAYATSRHQNDALTPVAYHRDSPRWACTCENCVMEHAKEETAIRWEQHWFSRGSLKALRYTHEEWLAKRRQQYAARKRS